MAADAMTPHSSNDGAASVAGLDPTLGFGNLRPVLHQLSAALRDLVERDSCSVIDLRALPFSPGEENELKKILGNGEVSALLITLGETELWETAYPGVWWIEHRNPEGQRIAQSLEVTWIPDILRSQPGDADAARERLDELLNTSRENLHEKTWTPSHWHYPHWSYSCWRGPDAG